MLLVILGAGASYDSLEPLLAENHDDRPPLASQLFDDRLVFRRVSIQYPEAFRLFPVLRYEGHQGSIEAALDRLQAESADHPARVRQLAALRFYIREAIEQVTARWVNDERLAQLNHHALLEQLDFARAGKRILIVTFNYDTFVEKALGWYGNAIDSLNAYTRNTDFPLFKLHGSVDWSREVEIRGNVDAADVRNGALEPAGLIKYAALWKEADRFVRGNITFDEGHHFVPAIAVPVQSKSGFQCPARHVADLVGDLPNVTRILTIGWRAQEQHFLTLLTQHLRTAVDLMCVSGDKEKSVATLEQLRQARLPIQSEDALDMGFSHAIRTRAAQDFMRIG